MEISTLYIRMNCQLVQGLSLKMPNLEEVELCNIPVISMIVAV